MPPGRLMDDPQRRLAGPTEKGPETRLVVAEPLVPAIRKPVNVERVFGMRGKVDGFPMYPFRPCERQGDPTSDRSQKSPVLPIRPPPLSGMYEVPKSGSRIAQEPGNFLSCPWSGSTSRCCRCRRRPERWTTRAPRRSGFLQPSDIGKLGHGVVSVFGPASCGAFQDPFARLARQRWGHGSGSPPRARDRSSGSAGDQRACSPPPKVLSVKMTDAAAECRAAVLHPALRIRIAPNSRLSKYPRTSDTPTKARPMVRCSASPVSIPDHGKTTTCVGIAKPSRRQR